MPEASLFHRWHSSRLKVLWLCYWVALFGIMHTPRERLPEIHVSNLDKVAHFTGYALLALLGGVYARRTARRITMRWCAAWWAAYALYAMFDELTQPFFHRTADGFDWLADILGVGIALTVVYLGTPRAADKDTA